MRQKVFLAMLGAGTLILTGYAQRSPKWTASVKSVQDDRLNENVDSVRGIGTSFGSVSWRQGDTPEMSIVDLTFNYGGTERELAWGIFLGRCRMASLPIAPVSSFPEIEFTGGGAARVQAKISYALPTSGQFHLNVYKDRSSDEASVVACGDFRYSAKG